MALRTRTPAELFQVLARSADTKNVLKSSVHSRMGCMFVFVGFRLGNSEAKSPRPGFLITRPSVIRVSGWTESLVHTLFGLSKMHAPDADADVAEDTSPVVLSEFDEALAAIRSGAVARSVLLYQRLRTRFLIPTG